MKVFKSQPATIGKGGKRIWCYPVEVHGPRTRVRTFVAALLLAVLYLAPFVQISGAPLVRLHFSRGHFFLFGQAIVLAEMYHFVLLAILLVIVLFLSSALWGRIWCGYACPQTIFIEHILRRIEYLVEGPALTRKANDARPKTPKYVTRKIVKFSLFLLVSYSFAATLVSYFSSPAAAWSAWNFTDPVISVMVVLFTGLAMFDGSYWREQFCTIACPYARFQSVFQDPLSKSFGYDSARGEPRGKPSAKALHHKPGGGDCIDCGLCVRVCPTAIDIRDGINQLECLNCGRCADACDSVMLNLKRPPGLVRFDTEARLSGKSLKWRLRKRVVCYALVALFVGGFGLYAFINHAPTRVVILTTGEKPYFRSGTRVSHLLQIKISNQTSTPEDYEISIDHQNLRIESPTQVMGVTSGETKVLPLLVSYEFGSYSGEIVKIEVRALKQGSRVVTLRSFAPPGNGAN